MIATIPYQRIYPLSKPPEKDNLDELIEREKRALAKEYFDDVWANASADGIDVEILSETFIEGALRELVASNGNAEASKLIAHFKNLDDMGFLPTNRTLQ